MIITLDGIEIELVNFCASVLTGITVLILVAKYIIYIRKDK